LNKIFIRYIYISIRCSVVHFNKLNYTVFTGVDSFWELIDLNHESLLDFSEDVLIDLFGHERNRQSLGAKPACPSDLKYKISNSVEVGIVIFWHVIVDDNIYPFNVNPSSEYICGNHYPMLKIFKILEVLNSIFLIHASMNCNGREVLFLQQFI